MVDLLVETSIRTATISNVIVIIVVETIVVHISRIVGFTYHLIIYTTIVLISVFPHVVLQFMVSVLVKPIDAIADI